MSKGYGTTLQLGTLSFRNSAATSALGLPTSLGLQEKLYLNYHSRYNLDYLYNLLSHIKISTVSLFGGYLEEYFYLSISDEKLVIQH